MTYPPGPPHPYGYGYPPPPPPPKPGVIPLAPLRVGDLLGGAFSAYGRYWKPLLGIAAIAYGGAGVLVGGVLLVAYGSVVDNLERLDALPDDANPGFADFQALLVAFGSVWLLGMLGMLVATALINAAVPAVIQDAVLGRPARFGTVLRRAWSRLGAVIGSVCLSSLAAALPAFLLVLAFMVTLAQVVVNPDDSGTVSALTVLLSVLLALASFPLALWLWVKFLFAPSAAVIENQGPVESLRRSAHLVRGSWWRIFGCVLLIGLIVSVAGGMIQWFVSILAAIPMTSLVSQAPESPRDLFPTLWGVMLTAGFVQLLVQTLLAPLQPLVTSLLYIDQRIRKENLAPMLAQSAAPAPAGAPDAGAPDA
ncbi:oxidoreductase [Streptomyces laurentii]|uniref:oxidoreductase n=1 Tax=Streptomyces laurentii TaxID=39478 RepID=UPI003686A1E1